MFQKFRLLNRITLTVALCALSLQLQAAQVSPTPVSNVDHGSIATGSAVTVLSAGTSIAGYRFDCLLQNNGANVMYYSFSGAATTSSFQLQPGFSMNCNNGVDVSVQALSVLGTAADKYALTEMFAYPQ